MSDDLVKRLRFTYNVSHGAPSMLTEAADAIERLRRIEDEWARLSQDEGKAEREIERLTAELATIRAASASVQADQRAAIDQARELLRIVTAERDALRADAERYRWLRSNCECMGWGNRSDAAIDAARAALKGTT